MTDATPGANDPWFRSRPHLAIGASAVMYAAIFVSRLSTGSADDAVLILLVFPISLLATTFGTRAGLLAGLLGAALVAGWVWIGNVDLSVVGWVSRIGPMVFLGILLGDAADRIRRAAEERRSFELAKLRHRQVIEVNDSLIQGMAAAKWSLESQQFEAASTALEETIAAGQRLVTKSLREENMGLGSHLEGGSAPFVPYVLHRHPRRP